MSGILYLLYLVLVLGGTLAMIKIMSIRFSPRKAWSAVNAIGIVALLFIAWDTLAVARGHWTFGPEHLMGLFIGNQPIEEILFFFIIPFFGLGVWEWVGQKNGGA
ncbi:MAG: lycopene cyclase domain-containing protein [Candidatus Diapherotrites archaeon]|nr:lycopene cyclase domain-containing protein [Candidatus Diapherotrites archaeon]MDZ4256723.1 lycopene cyclase domain-containing protein [archaeon]